MAGDVAPGESAGGGIGGGETADGEQTTGRGAPPRPAPDGSPPSKFVLFYEMAEAGLELAPLHFPAHERRLDEFQARGELLAVGAFADPVADGSMAIFTTREAAELFVDGDPFRIEGVIRKWTVKEWHEAYLG